MKLSVIIPCHNRGNLLREAVNSVLQQRYPVHEIIIADDGSNDDTIATCREIQRQVTTARVVISRSEQNLGAQVARNRGFCLATGEAVMFLDSDNVLANDGLPTLLRVLEQDGKLDYVFGKVVKTAADLTPLAGVSPVGGPFGPSPVEIAGYHWAIMGPVYRKDYLKRVGPWNETLTGSQDWEYQARVKLAGGRCEFVNSVVAYWRQHGGGRVGTNAFRPDYTESVIAACLSIARHARESHKYDRALAHKLAGRMFRHGLEFSAHGYTAEARRVFREVKQLPEISPYVGILMSAVSLSPRLLNRCVYQTIRACR